MVYLTAMLKTTLPMLALTHAELIDMQWTRSDTASQALGVNERKQVTVSREH